MNVQVINIQLYKSTQYAKVIDIVQYDNARIFQFELPSDYILEAEFTGARFSAKKPSGAKVKNPCVIDEDDNIFYQLTEQTSSEIGTVYCQLELYNKIDGKVITSFEFRLSVKRKINSDACMTSTDEWGVIEELREEVVEMRDDILAALESSGGIPVKVVNNTDSHDTTSALSANMGRVIKEYLNIHINDASNPHDVTTVQIGTYNKDEIDEKISDMELETMSALDIINLWN